MVGQPLNNRDEDNVELLISRDINDDLKVIINEVEQEPDLGVKIVHPSIDDDSKAIYSGEGKNNDENVPETPYDGENINDYSDDEGNNY